MIFINTCIETTLHRGDSAIISAMLCEGNNLTKIMYTLDESDEIYFAILEPNQCWENAIVKKKFTNLSGTELKIELKPQDTMCLLPGLYYYQVKLRKKDQVYTLNNRSRLYILE